MKTLLPPPLELRKVVGAPRVAGATGPAPAQAESADLFDFTLLRDYARFAVGAMRRQKLLALACFGAVLGLTVGGLLVLPKTYQVQTVIMALRNPVMSALANPGILRTYESDAPTRAARETVLRRDNLLSLIEKTNLIERWQEQRAPAQRFSDAVMRILRGRDRTHDEQIDSLVDVLEKQLAVDVSEGTVTLTLVWSNADTAYQLVDAAMQNFLETRHSTEISMVSDAISILEGHAASLQRQITDTVAHIQERERALPRPTARTVRRSAPTVARPAVDLEFVRLQGLGAAKHRALSDLEEFRQRRLAELQAQLSQYQTVYAPGHPALVSTRQTIEALSAPSPQIQALRSETAELDRELQGRAPASELAAPIQAFRDDSSVAALQLEPVDVKAEYDRSMLRLLFQSYSSAQERISAARVEMDAARAAFKYRYSVLSPPQLPKRPLKPNAPLVAVGGLVGALLFALLAATVHDLRSGLLVERWQIERELGIPVLGVVRRG